MLIFEALLLTLLTGLTFWAPTPASAADATFDVTGLTLTGLERTNSEWLTGYIDYSFPAKMTQYEVEALSHKLMTTGVFTEVKVTLEPNQVGPATYTLHVHVEEKWTTIPVIRG